MIKMTPLHVIGVIKSTGYTFENYLFFAFDIVLQYVHTSQQGPFCLR